MKNFSLKFLTLCLSIFAFVGMSAQDCAAPVALVSGTPLTGETTCGTGALLPDNACSGNYDADVAPQEAKVYTYTTGAAAEDVTVLMSNVGSTWSGLSVVSGTCGDAAATCEGFVGNSATTDRTVVAAGVPAATTLHIYVTTYPTPNCVTSYDISLTAAAAAPPPAGSSCALAVDLDTETSPYSGTTATAGLSHPYTTCGGTGNQMVHAVTVPDGYTLDIQTTVDSYDTRHSLYNGCPDVGTQILCFDDPDNQAESYTNISGVTQTLYWIQGAYSTASGTYTLEWTVSAPPTCLDPTGLAASAVTTTGLNADWSTTNAPSNYSLYVVLDGGTPTTADATGATAAGANSVALTTYDGGTAITADTDYDLYLQEDCSAGAGGSSAMLGPISFTTPCATVTPDYTTNFNTFLPSCWEEASASNTPLDPTTGPTSFGSGDWARKTQWNASGAAAINLYNQNTEDWMVSPTYDLSSGGYEVVIEVALTNYNSAAADPDGFTGTDDEVQLLYTEDGVTWSNIATWNAANEPDESGQFESFSLASTGSAVQFGIWGSEGSVDDGPDYDFLVNEFKVQTPPACPDVTSLAVANLSLSNVDISWTAAAGATNYLWEIQNAADPQGTMPAIASGTGAMTLAAAAGTYVDGADYVLYVNSDCGGSVGNYQSLAFTLNVPPANDNCDGAIALTVNADQACGSTTAGTVVNATASADDASACGGTEDDDVWFSFVATGAAHTIDLLNAAGSTTDLYHSVWEGTCPGGLTLVAGSCSDPNNSSLSSLTIGNTYYLRVYTWTSTSNQTTTFDVCIGTPPAPPANDNCDGAIALTVNADETCTSTTSGTVASATASPDDASACSGTEDDDVWFSFVATSAQHDIELLNAAGSTTDLYHSVWEGTCPGGLTLVAGSCSDPNTSSLSGLTVGNTYYLRVYTWTGTSGQTTTFDVCITTPPSPPANDDCADAIMLTPSFWGVPAWETFSTASATQSATSCTGTANDDIWFSWTAQSAQDVVMLRGAGGDSFDGVIEVYEGGCAGTSLICTDDGGSTTLERSRPGETNTMTAGTVYHFRVHNYFGSTSTSTKMIDVMVKTFEDGALSAPYCDQSDYQLEDVVIAERDDIGQLYSNPNVQVDAYQFLFEEVGGPFTVEYYNQDYGPSVQLTSVSGLEYGKTYNVSVKHRLLANTNGTIDYFWSDYGSTCTVAMAAGPTPTQLNAEFCGATDLQLQQLVLANAVPGATSYEFSFQEMSDGLPVGAPIVKYRPNYQVHLYTVPGLKYNSIYEVAVRADVNGVWTGPSATICQIATAVSAPAIAVQAVYCSEDYEINSSTFILADQVYGATEYTWRFVGGGTTQEVTTPTLSLYFHTADLDLVEGPYTVEVKATAGGITNDYGTACTIFMVEDIIPSSIEAPSNDEVAFKTVDADLQIGASIFPNPSSGGQVTLDITGMSGSENLASVAVFDISGKSVFAQNYPVKGEIARLLLDPTATFSSGSYLVTVTIDGQQTQLQLMVK